MDEREIILIGDVHGCLEELQRLLDLIKYSPTTMRLIFVGDLVDRGPDSVGCVEFVRKLGVECILGNHEEWYIRFNGHEKRRLATGKANPMRWNSAKKALHESLGDENIEWIKTLPLKLHLRDSWWTIHGGLESCYTLEDQQPKQIIRARYLNNDNSIRPDTIGRAVALNPDKSQPKGTLYWTDMWNGPESIVYGHCVHSLKNPLIDVRPNGVKCIGIDTGCVFGGRLTAFFLNENRFVQVQADKEYYHIDAEFED